MQPMPPAFATMREEVSSNTTSSDSIAASPELFADSGEFTMVSPAAGSRMTGPSVAFIVRSNTVTWTNAKLSIRYNAGPSKNTVAKSFTFNPEAGKDSSSLAWSLPPQMPTTEFHLYVEWNCWTFPTVWCNTWTSSSFSIVYPFTLKSPTSGQTLKPNYPFSVELASTYPQSQNLRCILCGRSSYDGGCVQYADVTVANQVGDIKFTISDVLGPEYPLYLEVKYGNGHTWTSPEFFMARERFALMSSRIATTGSTYTWKVKSIGPVSSSAVEIQTWDETLTYSSTPFAFTSANQFTHSMTFNRAGQYRVSVYYVESFQNKRWYDMIDVVGSSSGGGSGGGSSGGGGSSSTTSSTPSPTSGSSMLPIAIGAAVGGVACIALGIFLYCYYKKKRAAAEGEKEVDDDKAPETYKASTSGEDGNIEMHVVSGTGDVAVTEPVPHHEESASCNM